MNTPVFALVDCNNFFVSCERIFRPDLEGKPVVVLSSNDGCAVARSNEAKALGIPMGAPAFKYRSVFQKNNVISFSANFSLYSDISRRIIGILSSVTPRIEVYSVDESFLDLSQLDIQSYEEWGTTLRQKILEWVGVPVSIGIAPTKTLAKLAAEQAKKTSGSNGVVNLQGQALQTEALSKMAVGEVWGVGRRLAPQLQATGVLTALDLSRMRPELARSIVGVHGAQMISELKGIPCLPLEIIGKPCKSIARTRTFGEDTNSFDVMESAIASFVVRASQQLRKSKQVAKRISIFMTSNRHKPGYKTWQTEIKLSAPTNDTGTLIKAVVNALEEIFSSSAYYHRAGICLYDFVPQDLVQIDLLGDVKPQAINRSNRRMQTIDNINERFGKEHIGYAAEKLGDKWQPKYLLRSPRYVTHWDELPKVKIR